MNAAIITRPGPPSVLQIQTTPKPTPALNEALIQIRAFGLNHAEVHMRRGEWDSASPISGIECAGTVVSCPSNALSPGTTVVAVMGGMGRSRPGSYGEYVTVPVEYVVPIQTTLAWKELAALPEVYVTAWCCLFKILEVKGGERVLIRGATSTLGQAVVNLAVNAGAKITATTRRRERFDELKGMGVEDVKVESSDLSSQFATPPGFDKALNFIGNTALLDTVNLTRAGGRMLQAGWLGGLEPLGSFNPMLDFKSGVHFSLFHSGRSLGPPDFPLSEVPLQEIVRKIEEGEWDAKPARVFEFERIVEAHEVLDRGDAGGKIVVVH